MALTSRATHVLQWPVTMGSKVARWSKSLKAGLSSDWSLQLDSMKSESLVNAYQPRRVEYVLGFCTHRPSRQDSRGCLKLSARAPKVESMIGAKS